MTAAAGRWAKALDVLALLAAAALVVAVLGYVEARLWWGVDFTDEAFYAALPLHFALGAVPLRDEQAVVQFAGLFSVPIVQASLALHGGTEQLMVVMRHAHLAFTILVGAVVFASMRPFVGAANAAVTGAVCTAFSPFTLHSLSYNTLSCGFLTMALFLAARTQARRHTWRSWVLIGFLLGLGALVYPTLAVGVAAFAAITFLPVLGGRAQDRRSLAAFLAGGSVVAAAVVVLVLVVGMEHVHEMRKHLSAFNTQGGGWGKLLRVGQDMVARTPMLGALLTGAVLVLVVTRRNAALLGPILLSLLAVLRNLSLRADGTSTLYMVTAIACLAPLLAPVAGRPEATRTLMRAVWWPSMVCALVTSWSSSNGALNACIGAFPAALCTLVLVQMAWRRTADGTPVREVLARAGALAAPALVGAMLVTGDYKDYYGDPVPRARMTATVDWGPYKGLHTTPARAAQLQEFRQAVLPRLVPGDRALVFDGLPGGYLLLGLPAAANSVWLAPARAGEDRSLTVAYWQKRRAPTVAFITPQTLKSGDPLLGILLDWGFEPVVTVEMGTLLRRRP